MSQDETPLEVQEVVTLVTDYDRRDGERTVRLLLMSDGTVQWGYGEDR